jgi:5-methylcytosine-specific restriction endonuclease McrA
VSLTHSRDWRWHAVDQRTEHAIAALRRLPYSSYLRTAHWFRVKTLALKRAHHQCALCPSTDRLDVHHKSYTRRGFEPPEDVVVLCRECHARHHRTLALASVRATDREPVKAPMLPASSIRWLKDA